MKELTKYHLAIKEKNSAIFNGLKNYSKYHTKTYLDNDT